MNANMVSYYKERAQEYEKIYSKPERQNDLVLASQILKDIFAGKEVFEIACGTGYWTEKIASTAKSILATDINEAVIDIAKTKTYTPAKVDFETADIFNLTNTGKYESVFGGFIWSHIPLQGLDNFISIANNRVETGGTIVFMDNNYVEGSSLPVDETDGHGNTYQYRQLENGTTHKVIKNFPSEEFIKQVLAGKATELKFINLHYYWILQYKTNAIAKV